MRIRTADTPSRLEGAEHEIGNRIWVDHKPAMLSFTESQRGGSNPPLTAKRRGGLEMVPARSHKPNDGGSNPPLATKCPQATGS